MLSAHARIGVRSMKPSWHVPRDRSPLGKYFGTSFFDGLQVEMLSSENQAQRHYCLITKRHGSEQRISHSTQQLTQLFTTRRISYIAVLCWLVAVPKCLRLGTPRARNGTHDKG